MVLFLADYKTGSATAADFLKAGRLFCGLFRKNNFRFVFLELPQEKIKPAEPFGKFLLLLAGSRRPFRDFLPLFSKILAPFSDRLPLLWEFLQTLPEFLKVFCDFLFLNVSHFGKRF